MKAFAHRLPNLTPKGNPNFNNIFDDERALKMCGYKPGEYEQVTVTESAKGEYMGWVATGRSTPSMITLTQLFPVNFPYGYKAEEERGNGKAICLDIKPLF